MYQYLYHIYVKIQSKKVELQHNIKGRVIVSSNKIFRPKEIKSIRERIDKRIILYNLMKV